MGTLKVLIISGMYPPENSGGVAVHVKYLAQSLSGIKTTHKQRVTIVTAVTDMISGPKPFKPVVNFLLSLGSNGHFISTGGIPFEPVIKKCMDYCNSEKTRPDVIHVHDFEGIHIGGLLKKIFNIPLVFTVHKTPKEWDKASIKDEPKDFHLQAIIRMDIVDTFIAPSNAYKQQLVAHGVKKNKIMMIYHGIPYNYIASLNSKTILNDMHLTGRRNIIFAPIRLDEHKAPDVFIKAAIHVRAKLDHSDFCFVIAGTGSKDIQEEMNTLVEKYALKDIVIIGHPDNKPLSLAEMASIYRKAKICVLPSRREGFGQAILEAFAFKVPIIASNVGGVPEIIDSGVNGLLFDRDEPEKLAKRIVKLLDDAPLAKRLVEKGVETLFEKFEAGIMGKKYYDLYSELKRKNKTRRAVGA